MATTMDATDMIGKGLALLGFGTEARAVLTQKNVEALRKVREMDARLLEQERLLREVHAAVCKKNTEAA